MILIMETALGILFLQRLKQCLIGAALLIVIAFTPIMVVVTVPMVGKMSQLIKQNWLNSRLCSIALMLLAR